MSTMAPFLRRLHHLRPSLPLYLTSPFASSLFRFLSTATSQAPPPCPHFSVVDYLIQSVGLPSEVAIRASDKIQHLKSPDKPDSVLRFLRQTGVSESDIRTAVSWNSGLLCSSVENNLRPNVTKLQEIGLSIEDISAIVSKSPMLFRFNILPKVDFWMQTLGSLENMSLLLKWAPSLLHSNLEKVLVPNLAFLGEQCGLSGRQLVRLIKVAPRLIASRPEVVKMKAKKAEDLGCKCPSPMFVHALIIVCNLNQRSLDARMDNFKSLGFSQEELTTLVTKLPAVLCFKKETMGRKIEFLMKDVGCDKLYVMKNPCLLICSLEKRVIPRSLVQKLLRKRGFAVANIKFASLINPTEEEFVEKFVHPYEHAIPDLRRAYADACAGNIGAIDWFKSF